MDNAWTSMHQQLTEKSNYWMLLAACYTNQQPIYHVLGRLLQLQHQSSLVCKQQVRQRSIVRQPQVILVDVYVHLSSDIYRTAHVIAITILFYFTVDVSFYVACRFIRGFRKKLHPLLLSPSRSSQKGLQRRSCIVTTSNSPSTDQQMDTHRMRSNRFPMDSQVDASNPD